MKATRILSLSLISTGLACYLFSIIRGLGKDTALPFFYPQDLFADFFKLIASYPGRQKVQLENWIPDGISSIINNYIDPNPYGSNPAASTSSLTHFHLTPVTQIINIATRHLFDVAGPGVSFGIHFTLIFAFAAYLVSIAARTSLLNIKTILISGACITIYPSMFTLLRGYSTAYLVNLLVCCSFLFAVRPKLPLWASVFILSLAIGIRPNYILFFPLILIARFSLHSRHNMARQIVFASTISITSLLAAFLIACLLYKEYTINTFLNAYSFYSDTYEYGGIDNVWSSSLLQPLAIINTGLERMMGFQLILPSQLKIICLGFCLFVCLWCYIQLYKGRISISKSILVCCLAIIVGTPVFADYHLLVLLSPILVSLYYEREMLLNFKDPLNLNPQSDCQYSLLDKKSSCNIRGILSKADGYIIVFLTLPKTLPIYSGDLGSIQTFLNPLAICFYLALTISKIDTIEVNKLSSK